MKTEEKEHTYDLKTFNGMYKVYVDGYVMFSWNQIDFKAYYAYKDQKNLYGISIYLMYGQANLEIEVYFKTKQHWLNILKLLDEQL